MYRISGGCCYSRHCEECANYMGDKNLSCVLYAERYGTTWGGKRIACKYFRERQSDGQMDMVNWFQTILEKN